ncbi:MAG TPA: sialidase family protein [Clostridiales bacterium]|mgnify:CR=1 FL=1|nr:sialidase family protein [Clostridiales bacterium]
MSEIGRSVLEIPPSEENKRNSEGAFITLKDGRILFAYTYYGAEGWRDESQADIAFIFSDDEGETWSEKEIVFKAEDHDVKNIMSVSFVRFNNDDIGIFYLVKRGFEDNRLVMRRSFDEGKTWSDPKFCINRKGFNVVNNDRVVKLSNGRLIFPSAHHGVRPQPAIPFFPYAIDYFYFSDDDGENWYENEFATTLNSPHTRTGLQEPGLVELAPGLLWAWSRTDMGRQYEFFSNDNGFRWGNPEPSYFTGPCSPLSVKRIPQTGELLAVWNPIPEYPTSKNEVKYSPRKRLVYATSDDNGATWGEPVIIEDDDECGYCYTAIHFTSDSVLLGYCAGNEFTDYSILSRIRIRKIKISDLG